MTDNIFGTDNVIHQTEHVVVLLPEKPAAPGHVIITPIEKAPILESVPDLVIGEMALIANKFSIALFEGLRAGGTNIIMQNGVPAGQTKPQAHIHVIPRREGDGLPLEWDPQQLPPDKIQHLAEQIKKEASGIGVFKKEPAKPLEEDKPEEINSDESNYLIKQLRRIP